MHYDSSSEGSAGSHSGFTGEFYQIRFYSMMAYGFVWASSHTRHYTGSSKHNTIRSGYVNITCSRDGSVTNNPINSEPPLRQTFLPLAQLTWSMGVDSLG